MAMNEAVCNACSFCFQIGLSDEAVFLYTRLELPFQFEGTTDNIYSLDELLVSESLMVGHKQ